MVTTALVPTGEALWAKVLTISADVSTGEFQQQPPDNGEGCTPGFWKQPHHFDEWPDSYEPDQPIGDAFELAVAPDITLLEALQAQGGDLNALLRHAVAALLNAAHPKVDYPLTVEEVIALFQQALTNGDVEGTKDLFEEANEAECPLPMDDEDDGEDDDVGECPGDEDDVGGGDNDDRQDDEEHDGDPVNGDEHKNRHGDQAVPPGLNHWDSDDEGAEGEEENEGEEEEQDEDGQDDGEDDSCPPEDDDDEDDDQDDDDDDDDDNGEDGQEDD
jgi:hypothetical protein